MHDAMPCLTPVVLTKLILFPSCGWTQFGAKYKAWDLISNQPVGKCCYFCGFKGQFGNCVGKSHFISEGAQGMAAELAQPGGDDCVSSNPKVILANLRAENKLLRRKTLKSILAEIKSLQQDFDSKGASSSQQLEPKRKAINTELDSDDEDDKGEQEDADAEEGDVDFVQNPDGIVSVYGSVDNLIKSLTLSLSDPVESCRELAYESLTVLVEKCGRKRVCRMLPFLIPTLVARLAQPELIEPSEEVRLLAVDFIGRIVCTCRKEAIPFIDDLIAIMVCTLEDPYHEVRIQSCKVTCQLGIELPEVFHYSSERLAKPLCVSLTHQQSRVRKAVVECIGDVLQHGSHKPAENYVPHLIQRLFDPNPAVRKTVVTVVGNWMMHFSERYSHFHRFLPIILTGLCDESPDISETAANLWAKIGDTYLEENVQEYKDFVDFPPEHPTHYPNNVKRPNFGCRMMTHREVCKLIPGVTHEIMDWQESNRQKSAQLLYYLILNCEDKMTMHVEPIFQCMFRACLDSNPIVIKYVLQAATLIGYFVPISTCWPLLSENLASNPSEGCLAVTCSYLKGVSPKTLPQCLSEIVELISSPEICQTLHVGKLGWIMSICETLLALVPNELAEQSQQEMFQTLLILASMSRTEEIVTRVQSAMDILRQFSLLGSVDDLFGLYAGPVLQKIKAAEAEWTMNTPERLIFTTILTQAGSGIEKNMDLVLDTLISYLGPKRDPEVRLSLFAELAGILRVYSEMEQEPHQVGLIQSFVKTVIEDILNKSLVWRAGKSAGALRAAALNCLLTILLGNLLRVEMIESVALDISSGCIALLDDQLYLNRLFSAKCLGQLFVCCGEKRLSEDYVNKIYPELLKRMDDENKDVRMAASHSLTKIYANLPSDYTISRYKPHLEHVVGTLLVHLDDRDAEIQETVFGTLTFSCMLMAYDFFFGKILGKMGKKCFEIDTLSTIGSVSSHVVISKCESFKSKHRSPDYCDRLISKLSSENVH